MSAHLLSDTPISFERRADGSIAVYQQKTDAGSGVSVTTQVCFISAAEWDELVSTLAIPATDAAPSSTEPAITEPAPAVAEPAPEA